MLRQKRKTTEAQPSGPSGFGDPFAWGPSTPGTVEISSGLNIEQIAAAGMTVGEIRQRFDDRFEIRPGATAFVDGEEAGDATVLREGQSLSFVVQAGERGAVPSRAGRAIRR